MADRTSRKKRGKRAKAKPTASRGSRSGIQDNRGQLVIEFPHYDPDEIVDAPEFHSHCRALGVLTWGTFDHGVRSFEHRRADFVAAFPPHAPVQCLSGDLVKGVDGSFQAWTEELALQRFNSSSWAPGSLWSLLARYGLKMHGTRTPAQERFEPSDLRATARRRNARLRVLHGGVDIEAQDMDAAKADYLERSEKVEAARQVRAALRKMKAELRTDEGDR